MKNVIYRIELDDLTIEFNIYETNELNPRRDTREMGVNLVDTKKGLIKTTSLDHDDIEALRSFLSDAKDYMTEFNRKSLKEAQKTSNLE